MARPYRGATDEALEAWQAATQAGTSRLGTQVGITLLGAFALGLLFTGVLVWANAVLEAGITPTVEWGLAVFGGMILAVVCWSVLAITQRALVIVDLEGAQAPRGRGGRQIGGVLGIAVVLAGLDTVITTGSALTTLLDPESPSIVLFGVCMIGAWWILRAFVGVATARAALDLDGPLAALRRSGDVLYGFRIAALMSRLPIWFLGGLELFLLHRSGNDGAVIVLSSLLGACATTVDAWIEHAWHRRLRPDVDQAALAAVFD